MEIRVESETPNVSFRVIGFHAYQSTLFKKEIDKWLLKSIYGDPLWVRRCYHPITASSPKTIVGVSRDGKKQTYELFEL